MAGVVASNVRNIRAKSLSLKDTQDQEAEVLRKMQQRQDQITANNQWKRKVVIIVLEKVPSEANPKVRNHGEGPY